MGRRPLLAAPAWHRSGGCCVGSWASGLGALGEGFREGRCCCGVTLRFGLSVESQPSRGGIRRSSRSRGRLSELHPLRVSDWGRRQAPVITCVFPDRNFLLKLLWVKGHSNITRSILHYFHFNFLSNFYFRCRQNNSPRKKVNSRGGACLGLGDLYLW